MNVMLYWKEDRYPKSDPESDQKQYNLTNEFPMFKEHPLATVVPSQDEKTGYPNGKWWSCVNFPNFEDPIYLPECDTLREAKNLCIHYITTGKENYDD